MPRLSTPTIPPFLAVAGHPLRWRLMMHLAHSDRQVGELTHLVEQPQNLVSYHLGRLTRSGLVSSRRSSFDGRAAYYRLHLDRCGALLHGVGAALHPGLLREAALPTGLASTSERRSVLFTCTGNGSRSQMAEALLRQRCGDSVEVQSAGSHPKPVHANAIAALADRGIDIADARSTSLAEFSGRRFDYVVTLCDRVREVCPEFAERDRTMHWSIADPSALAGPARANRAAYRALAEELDTRIGFLVALIDSHTTQGAERYVP